ncbi:MAG: hypothetical protein WDN04_18525 [Rhodospirillales bacterium]
MPHCSEECRGPSQGVGRERRIATQVGADRASGRGHRGEVRPVWCRGGSTAGAGYLEPFKISERLDTLAQAVDGADGAPTADARAGYHKAVADMAGANKALAAVRVEVEKKGK